MKKLICSVIFLSLLCGCSAQNQNFAVNIESLNTSFSAEIDDYEIKGKISFDSNLNMFITLTFPENISGLSFVFNKDTVTSSFDGVSNTYSYSDLPEEFALLKVFSTLKNAVCDGGFKKSGDSTYVAEYNGIKITADINGNIKSLTLKNGYVTFG